MNKNSFKQDLLELVSLLPDKATLDDFLDTLDLETGLNEAEADINAGRVHTQEEVIEMLKQWNQSRSLER